jgi:uncharacterized membrane protein
MSRVIEVHHPSTTQARGSIPPPRVEIVDMARGAALVAMIVYHFVWDLGFFGLIDAGVAASPPMRGASHAIASAFLLFAGVSVALAHRGRFEGRRFRSQFVKVALVAAAVTLVTAYALPQAPITFGILHAIALGLLVTAALAKAPFALTGALGLAMIAAPLLFSSPFFDAPGWSWTGLGTMAPTTLDWRPALPWVGVMTLGLALARSPAGQAFLVRAGQAPGESDAPTRGLVWLGRRSLWVYLAHQPILMGLLWAVAQAGQVAPSLGRMAQEKIETSSGFEASFANSFQTSCVTSCTPKAPEAVCASVCACTLEEARASGAVKTALTDPKGFEAKLREATELCLRKQTTP